MMPVMHYWTFDLASLAILLALGLLYGSMAGWRRQRGAGLYGAGLVLLALVQFSPLHTLALTCSMSAHMIGHMLLLLVVAPLLVLGLPRRPTSWSATYIDRLSAFFSTAPWLGWLTGLGTMWFWHIPATYRASLAHGDTGIIPLCTLAGPSTDWAANLIHLVHPISLVMAGVCFAWPLLGPRPSQRMFPLTGVLYLFTACIGCSLLGMLITFAPAGSYYPYVPGQSYYAMLSVLPTGWPAEPAVDQQMAGLLMWVPGCLIYLTGAISLFIHWITDDNEAGQIAPVH